MAAKKIAPKKATRTTKAKPTPKKPINPAQEIEKEISSLNLKLEKLREKERLATSKHLDKQKASLAKANIKISALREKKQAVALKVKIKKTAANQKQLLKANDTLIAARTNISELKDGIAETRELLAAQKATQGKANAIKKALASVDKQWRTKEKPPAKVIAPKKVTTSTKKKATTSTKKKAPASKLSSPKSAPAPKSKGRGRPKKIVTAKKATTIKPTAKKANAKAADTKAATKKAPKKMPKEAKAPANPKKSTSSKKPAAKTATPSAPVEPLVTKEASAPLIVAANEIKEPALSSVQTNIQFAPAADMNADASPQEEAPKENPADTQESEPGRSIFDPDKDM
ncbi:MAG: hypothetical protein KUG76_06435 [Gammaproteobacteria bacterium]|nr:hypothetical protein [Gammaproteobacteria bacterium]